MPLGTLALLVSFTASPSAQTQTVEGNRYPNTVEAVGRTLTLVGAGLRERWWFDVYTMGAYAERRSCDPQMLIATDQAKSLRIDLLRDVDAKTMAGALENAFERNLPPNAPPRHPISDRYLLGLFPEGSGEGGPHGVDLRSRHGNSAHTKPGAAGMDVGREGLRGPVVEFLFQPLNLLRRPQEANSRPVFPNGRLAAPGLGAEMTDSAGRLRGRWRQERSGMDGSGADSEGAWR